MASLPPPCWDEVSFGFGLDFGPAVANKIIRMVSARWLVQQPMVGTVVQMQLLPPEAFFDAESHAPTVISAEQRRALPSVSNAMIAYTGIVMLSYPWLTRENPDPAGYHLATVQKFLKKLLERMARNGVQDVGLFWDFLSLPQHLVDRVRTAEEALVFKAGLGCLASLYSHQFTHVIQLKDAPGRDYDASGWCFFEQSVASVMKAESMLLDLSKVSDWTCWKAAAASGRLRRADQSQDVYQRIRQCRRQGALPQLLQRCRSKALDPQFPDQELSGRHRR